MSVGPAAGNSKQCYPNTKSELGPHTNRSDHGSLLTLDYIKAFSDREYFILIYLVRDTDKINC